MSLSIFFRPFNARVKRMPRYQNFEGKIFISSEAHLEKKVLMNYKTGPLHIEFEQTIMASFSHLHFSSDEKKKLSNQYRKNLNRYRMIDPRALELDARHLVDCIAKSKTNHIVIEAYEYGVYICLAALYSGNISFHKKIDFHFEESPLALFPKTFFNNAPPSKDHKIFFRIKEDCWLLPFRTLYNNDKIKCFYLKAA